MKCGWEGTDSIAETGAFRSVCLQLTVRGSTVVEISKPESEHFRAFGHSQP